MVWNPTLEEIERANFAAGYNWFAYNTMRWFKSELHGAWPGGYFISSEKNGNERRRYTLRQAFPDGQIETVGEFQQYSTLKQAQRAAITASTPYAQELLDEQRANAI